MGAVFALASPLAVALGAEGDLIEQARSALARGEGVTAEVLLKQARDGGTPRNEIAAYMGEAELLQDDLVDARDWLGAGAFSSTNWMRGFHMLALLEMREGNLPAAGQAFDKALEKGPGNSRMWVDIGRLRYAGGEHHLALAASLRSLELDPQNARALEFRGQLARDSDGPRAGLAWFRQGLEAHPGDVSLMGEYAATLGELGQARAMLATTRQMIAADGSNSRAFYLQAVLAARANQPNLARRLLWKMDAKAQEFPAFLLLDGLLDLRAGNGRLAAETFRKLVRLQPDNPKARLLLGRALLENGDAAEVIAQLGALAKRPDASPYLLTLVARAYEMRGMRDDAGRLLDRAAHWQFGAMSPLPVDDAAEINLYRWGADSARPEIAVTRIRKFLGAQDYRGAGQVVASLAERFPGSADIQILAGDVAFARGETTTALDNYTAAALIRRNFSLIQRIAAAHRSLDQHGAAWAVVSDYIRQHPQDGEAAALLGHMAFENRQWDKAQLLLSYAMATGHGRGDPWLLAKIAKSQLETGKAKEALATASRAFNMHRANPQAMAVYAQALRQTGDIAAAGVLDAKMRRLGKPPGFTTAGN